MFQKRLKNIALMVICSNLSFVCSFHYSPLGGGVFMDANVSREEEEAASLGLCLACELLAFVLLYINALILF